MIILTIRSDNPQAEISLYDSNNELDCEKWEAHRQLSETIHLKIEQILKSQNLSWQAIQGVVCYQGPGSFTGLRIGLTVGNTLAYGLEIPIVSTTGKSWINKGIKLLVKAKNDNIVLPKYGASPKVTSPKK